MRSKFFTLSAKGTLTVVLLFVTLMGWTQNSRKVVINNNSVNNSARLISQNSSVIEIQFSLNELNLREVKTQEGTAFLVESSKAPNILTEGDPDLFYLSRSIVIPDLGTMEVEVFPGDYQEINDIEIAPSKGNLSRSVNPSDIPFVKGAVYNENAFYPKNIVSMRDPYIVRDLRGQSIDVYPVQYNPITKTLRIYSTLKVVVKHNNKKGINEFVRTKELKKFDTEYLNIYRSMFLNFNSARYTPLNEDGEMLIICYDDFMEAMQPFVNWKNTMGRKTTMVSKTTAGSTSSAIKTYITNYYNNPANNLTYVLLVGDAPQIPTNNVSGSGDSDNAYGYMTGSDSYNEIFIGRFSAETVAHVETQVERLIHYERDINTSDTWLNTGLGVSRNEGEGSGHFGEADYQHIDFIRDTLLNYTYSIVHREYEAVSGLPSTNAASISQRINEGTSIISYCNHGSVDSWGVAGYSNTHVNALTNVGKLPFILSVACVNGDFRQNYCFAEAWLRATHNGSPTGAIATIMSTINQDWQPPMTAQDEMINILTENHQNNIKRTFAGISINGSMLMIDDYGATGKKNHDTWTVFGDPSLLLRTDVPQEMAISHNPTIFLGSSSFTVSSDTDGATVTLSYINDNQNVVILGTSVVENGNATIIFAEPITQPIDITVAVIGLNKVTYIDQISAVPADEPYVVLHSFETTAAPNYGQAIGINVELKNFSENPNTASNFVAVISTESPFATITNNSVSAGTIIPDQVANFSNAFGITISNNVPDQTVIQFSLQITGEYNGQSYSWSQNFIVKANAPLLTVQDFEINDNNQGIPGVLDPGETANISFSVINQGHAASSSIAGVLSTQSPYLNINQSTSTINALEIGATGEISFTISAYAGTPLETTAVANLSLNTSGNVSVNPMDIVIGVMPSFDMTNTTVTTCMARFFDPAGANANYSNNENKTMTFLPSTEGAMMKVVFESFNTESNYDYLKIYNGLSSSAPQLANLNGTNLPGEYIATNEDGALTFVFTSDGSVSAAGWEAIVSCEGGVNNDAFVLTFDFEEDVIEQMTISNVVNNAATIDVAVTMGTDISALTPTITLSLGAQISPDPGVLTNFTNGFTYSVTSESGSVINNYTVNVTEYNPLFTATFTVLNNGTPIQGASVLINNETIITSATGVATISLHNGSYDFAISATGFENYTSSLTINGVDISQPVNMTPVGINAAYLSKIAAYPNPFTNEMVLKNVAEITQLIISNSVGNQVVSLSNNGSDVVTISTDQLPSGFYLVTLKTKSGEMIVKKMIKQ